MDVGVPRTLIEVNVIESTPSPLNLPGGLASTIGPATPAPEGIATAPSTDTECARVPVNESPGLAVLVLMVLPMRTTKLAPAGTTNGGGGGGGGGGAWAICCWGAGVGAGAICCGGCCAGAEEACWL